MARHGQKRQLDCNDCARRSDEDGDHPSMMNMLLEKIITESDGRPLVGVDIDADSKLVQDFPI